jgi:hypothetical protein
MSVLGGLVGLAFAVALFLRFGPGDGATSQLLGFEVLSDTQVRVSVEVAREPGTETFCVLRARAADGAQVGRNDVDVPPSADRVSVLTAVVTTDRRPVTGEVVGCTQGRAAAER